jgi:hypothetical protein
LRQRIVEQAAGIAIPEFREDVQASREKRGPDFSRF